MSAHVDPVIVEMEGLPRQNGELLFEAPWEARAFGIAVALCREQGIEWDAFRQRLIEEIATWERAHGSEPSDAWSYYERWAASLERLVLELGLVREAELAGRADELAHLDRHDHDHDHHHPGDGSERQAASQDIHSKTVALP
jgi:nitrile hydratase accessory protein